MKRCASNSTMQLKSFWAARWKNGFDSQSVFGILSEEQVKQFQVDIFVLNNNGAHLISFFVVGADPFGQATIKRNWDDGTETIENYKRRLEAAFEFFTKLGNNGFDTFSHF
jgi:hypothetical protein